ncbi:MAG: hypothetical protein ABIS50_25965 [Luteolibacter sp.]|uniref:hypothetical protein n=1 Tax=Luteolibacter sp. TaxID=1962973 RepID=UPI0032635699
MKSTKQSNVGLAYDKQLQPGFALIVTLSLMILLTVIAVGLLTLSSISLRSSSQGNAMAVARANARVALMLAIGDLQKNAGPDQRVTARADVIDEKIANPRLTGVWDSWEIKPTTQASDYVKTARDGRFRSWLVSGDPTENARIGFAGQAPLSTSAPASSPLAVTLWGKGTLGDAAAAEAMVTANKVPITSSPGALAWAVMDEGVKVRINTHYADNAVTNAQKTVQLGTGERPGVEFIAGLNGLDRKLFEKSAPDAAALDKGISPLNFSLAAERLAGKTIPAALKPLAHDVTTVSNGLFTDTARGGLRQDFHLMTNIALPAEYSGKGVYASRQVLPSGVCPSDPRWESLQQFATVYKDIANLTRVNNVPVLKAKAPPSWSATTLTGNPPTTFVTRAPPAGVVLMPTIAKVQMLFSLIGRDIYPNLPGNIQRPLTTAEKTPNMHGPQDGWFRSTKYNYDLHLLYTPIVTLHNPYNVAISFNSLRLEFIGVPFAMQVFRNDVPLSKGLVPFESMTDDNQDSQQGKVFGMELKTKVNNQVGGSLFTMLPGEVILFSPYLDPKRTYAQDLTDRKFWDIQLATGITTKMDSIPGWRGFGIGYDCDWLAGNQPSIGNPRSEDPATAQPPYGIWKGCYGLAWDDKIHVLYAPLSIPPNKNKFIIQMSATVAGSAAGKKVAAIEMDYDKPTGLQEFLSPTGGQTTLRYPKDTATNKYVMGYQLRDSSTTPIGGILNAKPFALLTAQAKTTSGGRDSTNKEGRYSGKPWSFAHGIIGTSSQKVITEHPANHSHEIDLLPVDENDATQLLSIDSQDRSVFISGATSTNGTKFGTVYDIPLAPVQTLASLNGANPGGSSGYLPRFAQPIGNSWAHPLISPDKISESGPTSYNYLDHSFLLNLALYDGFYFSGFADQSGNFGTAGRLAKTVADDFSKGIPLDDPRLTLRLPNGKLAADLSPAIALLTAYKTIAAWETMNGAFNINSTSVQAWKAMLASIHDSQALVNQRSTAAAIATSLVALKPTATTKVRISRMRLPDSSSAADGAAVADGYWLGPREYSDAELQTLAENIVKQVRLRGPFLSMAEFVNRRLGSDEMAQCGALQQAIDDSNLNKKLADAANAGFEIPTGSTAKYKYKNSKAGEGPSYQGAPGYLTQADILNVLGNAATARSDTFTIRGYGESRDRSGKLLASATCEAVIQRIPDWIDPADAVETPVASLVSTANRTFGRRFQVTSFRWLNANEI